MSRTAEYLESLVERAKPYLPPWLFRRLHLSARGAAGGKLSPKPEGAPWLERMAFSAVTAEALEEASDKELLVLHLRTHQLQSSLSPKEGKP